jgi:hypothetical protein
MCAADLLGWSLERVAKEAGIPVLLEASIKVALDLEWSVPDAKTEVINILIEQIDVLDAWLRNKLPEEMSRPPLKEHVETLAQIRAQNLEPDPSGGGRTRIRQRAAPDRRVSIEDPEMPASGCPSQARPRASAGTQTDVHSDPHGVHPAHELPP